MIPIIVDPCAVKLAVVGQGPAAVRRVRQLVEGGSRDLLVFSPRADQDMREAAGPKVVERLPESTEFEGLSLVYFAGLDLDVVEPLADAARRQHALVNVEDVMSLCDFHVPGMVRRGDLLFTVSTGGKSPGLARRLRQDLENSYGPEWDRRLEALAKARRGWLDDGDDLSTVAARTNGLIEEQGWLA